MTEAEIKAKYKALHDTLSESYYNGTSGLTKEEFDYQHGKVWADMEAELIAEGYITLPEPPRSTHFARIDSFYPAELKPLRVVRTWEGNDYTYDCFVTETLKDQFLAGDVVVGDYVLVHFDDSDREVAMLKIFKSW